MRHGTWELYYPARIGVLGSLGYWIKQDFNNEIVEGDEYDRRYDDGFLITVRPDGRIEKGYIEKTERHGEWEFYFPE